MKIIYSLMILCSAAMLHGCSGDDDDEFRLPEGHKGKKTVLIYMAGRNSLSEDLDTDLEEIKDGSKNISDEDNLIVFVRRYREVQPWVARIKNGVVTDSVSMTDLGLSTDANMASDPQVMERVMDYVFTNYPATGDYGLVLWGHSLGWLMKDEVAKTRAYAYDVGNNGMEKKWINMVTLAEVLGKVPHLRYVMADCCCFMCLESLYELRGVADYFIGSPAEIPAKGAPYYKIIPDLFSEKEDFYVDILDKYTASMNGKLLLSVVRTDKMDELAQATRFAWLKAKANFNGEYADLKGLIHYYYYSGDKEFMIGSEYNIFYDAGDFFKRYLPEDDYQEWLGALNETVVDRRMAKSWTTVFSWDYYRDFTMKDELYHGVSMFIPQDPDTGEYSVFNEDIKQYKWYEAVLK